MVNAQSITVLTFNLWGIFNSRHCPERMAHFATKVRNYDIILLQEQFSPDDFALIIELLPADIRESRFFRRFPSSFYGSGCAVISKYPINSAMFMTYPLQGLPEMVLHGDFFANKGAAHLKVTVPVETESGSIVPQEVCIYTTHLVAVYQKVSQMRSWRQERYIPYRISQAVSLADFIINTSKPTDCVIIGGDFNSSQRSLEVQVLLLMLKRHGYQMRSVLPTPNTFLEETGRNMAMRDIGKNLYTYSYRNRFNASKTSYFKLLKLEADIPSQIDHIFFSNNTLTLKSFEECPDAARDYAFNVEVNGTTQACGVVVFTSNDEVAVPVRPSVRERVAVSLHALATHKSMKPLEGAIGWAARALMPSQTAAQSSPKLVPLSDHYGVAAKLYVRAFTSPSMSSPPPELVSFGDDGHSVPLTEEEEIVLETVVQFLDEYVARLRRHTVVTRYIAAASLGLLGFVLWSMRGAHHSHQVRTEMALQQVYNFAAQRATEARGSGTMDKVTSWVRSALYPSAHDGGATTPPPAPQAHPSPNFKVLSKELMSAPLWTQTGIGSTLTIASALVGVSSMGIGMLQRRCNANILEEQVQQLREL